MIIRVASMNPVKIEATREVLQEYPLLSKYQVGGVETNSQVSAQPKSLEETVQGAVNRAKTVFEKASLSFGIESGLMKVPQTKTGYMDICVCAIYDGREPSLGLSCAFELPLVETILIFDQHMDINEATYTSGLSSQRKIGSSEGIIGLLTKGRVTRKEYTKQAIRMALIQIENKSMY